MEDPKKVIQWLENIPIFLEEQKEVGFNNDSSLNCKTFFLIATKFKHYSFLTHMNEKNLFIFFSFTNI